MTATPHNGKEEDFQLFLSLLDSDRFYGKFRDGVHKVDVSDLMRRMVKEELVKFDGTPLFPERRAYTVNYKLSDLEAALYEAVTDYVQDRDGQGRPARTAQRKGSVGFALTALQRRLASSPEAIYQSLKRRRKNASKRRLREEKLGQSRQPVAETLGTGTQRRARRHLPEIDDDLTAEEQENLEEDPRRPGHRRPDHRRAGGRDRHPRTASKNRPRPSSHSGQDRKWDELSRILQTRPEMRDAGGRLRKLIIFTEHRDTLNYLHDEDRRRARQPGGHRHDPRRHPPRRAPQGCRSCSAPTPTSASWSPPMPPAKA